jgi:hypothetical protein
MTRKEIHCALLDVAMTPCQASAKEPPAATSPSRPSRWAGGRLGLRAAVVAAMVCLGSAAQARDVEPQILLRAKELPRGVKAPKGFESALRWTDKNGENLLILALFKTSGKDATGDVLPSAVLTIDHLLISDGQKTRSLRSVRDGVEPCDFDLTAEFLGDAELTDLDADGIAEVTVAYQLSCKSDVSPDIVKLLVLENGEKYILRGESMYPGDNGKMLGGKFKPDPDPAKWPKVFLDHARATWKQIVK